MSTWIPRLTKFQRPAGFLKIVQETASVPNDRFFIDPAYRPLLEAWVAGHFALGLESLFGSAEVRLDSDHFPDFRVRVKGREHGFELTTAEKPERRRDREYKERKDNPLLLTPHQPARGRAEGPLWVADGVRKKYDKHYNPSPHLLVYANFEADELEPAETADACRQLSASFKSIWVLWAYRFVQLFDSEEFRAADLSWRMVGVDPWAI